MKRAPVTDWWPSPKPPSEPSKPSTTRALLDLERELENQLEMELQRTIDYEKADAAAVNNPQQHPFHPKSAPNPGLDIIELYENAHSVTVTYRPQFVRQRNPKSAREVLMLAEQVICNMPGGDMILIKDRFRQTPVILQHGNKPYQQNRPRVQHPSAVPASAIHPRARRKNWKL